MLYATVGMLLLAAPAAAQAPEPAPPAAQPKADDPVICKQQQTTGTRLGAQRICMPRSQWDLQQRELEAQRRQQGEIRPNAPR
jgi:hypothetical protein